MTPSATATPKVPVAANVGKYDQVDAPPAQEVAQSIIDEDESIHDLFSLKGSAVISKFTSAHLRNWLLRRLFQSPAEVEV